MAKEKKKEMTLDYLASVVQRGFAETATKKEIYEITERLDRIEFHMSTHERRIEILEDQMRVVSNKIGLRR